MRGLCRPFIIVALRDYERTNFGERNVLWKLIGGIIMGKALKFEKEITAIYIFCDIRDFSKKIKESSDEMKKILEVYYSLALKVFGKFGSKTREDGTFKKIVKFIGDGFFCVNEYTDGSDLINEKMDESIKDISNFDKKFKETITNLGLSEISLPINLG